MTDWYLELAPKSVVTLDVGERLLRSVIGDAVEIRRGEMTGNPRDFYTRTITIAAQSPVEPMRVELGFLENMRGENDPEAYVEFQSVKLHTLEAPFAMMLATWHALRDAFAQLGCIDRTIPQASMVDDAEAAGDVATGEALRAQTTAQLLAKAREERHVHLSHVRLLPGSIEDILAAYPDGITSVVLWGLGLMALPAGFARFTEIDHLTLLEDDIDASVLRGLARPRLTTLNVRLRGLSRVTREDLAGFPLLGLLAIEHCQLEDLDADIIDVCPKLYRVMIAGTPLAKNPERIATLRARWPGVHTWDLKGLFD